MCTALLLITMTSGVQGCADRPHARISREQFVDAYVRMVRARIDAEGDSSAYAARRDRAFAEAGVSAQDMRAFVEGGRFRPEELRAAWQAIAVKLDTLYGGVTSRAPPDLREAFGAPPKKNSAVP